MPEANTLCFGVFPPGPFYSKFKEVQRPLILDWDVAHPLLSYIRDLSLIVVARARIVDPPPGATRLIESSQGTLAFSVPRDGYIDTIVGFPLMDGTAPNSTWFRHLSFPLFILNSVQTLGNLRESSGGAPGSPGRPIALHVESPGRQIQVTSADGRSSSEVTRSPQGTFVYNQANATGIYHARWEPDGVLPFVVNLFDPRESDLATRGLVPAGTPNSQADPYKIKIGDTPVSGMTRIEPTRIDGWKALAFLALVLLLIEWTVYNRRVFF